MIYISPIKLIKNRVKIIFFYSQSLNPSIHVIKIKYGRKFTTVTEIEFNYGLIMKHSEIDLQLYLFELPFLMLIMKS